MQDRPNRDLVAAELGTVALQGLKARRLHLKLDALSELGRIECVRSRPVEQRAEVIRDLIAEAVGTLPPESSREALEALLGIGVTAELPHASRRSAAMQALGLDPTVHSEHSFRKTREKELLWDLAGVVVDVGSNHCAESTGVEIGAVGTRLRGDDGAVAGAAAGTGAHRRGGRPGAVTRAAVVVAVAGLFVSGVALVAWQRVHPSRPARASDDLVVTTPLRIDPSDPRVGDAVTATFVVGRQQTGPEAVVQIAAGGREDPTGNACTRSDPIRSWTAATADFPVAGARSLATGRTLTYRGTRTFDKPGSYFAEPVKQTEDGRWGGIPNANRVCFTVRAR